MNRHNAPLRLMPTGTRSGPDPRARVIAVAAGKGGAGASTFAALLAFAAAAEGRATLLVDAQPLGSLHLMLGVGEGPGLDAMRTGLAPERMAISLGGTLDFVAAADSAQLPGSAERRALFRRVVGLFERYDVVIVDAGSRLEGVLVTTDAGADMLIVVTSPDPIGLASAHALFKAAAARSHVPDFGAVINPAADHSAAPALAVLEQGVRRFIGADLLRAGALPEDPELRTATAAGVPLAAAVARSPVFDAAVAALRVVCPAGAAADHDVPFTAVGS